MRLPARAKARCQVEDVWRGEGGQWYVGPGRGRRLEAGATIPVPPANAGVRCGAVRTGEWADRRGTMTRNGHWLRTPPACTVDAMKSITSAGSDRHLGPLVGDALLGATLVATGLGFAFLAIDTPFVAGLVPASRMGASRLEFALAVWALAIVAGASLLVAGTNRLATTMARARMVVRAGTRSSRSPVSRALAALPADVIVVPGVIPRDGRPTPGLVVGPFGVAVVHELRPRDGIRGMGRMWEERTSKGWRPAEHPLDRAARDAERVRHWVTHGDLDFVVRVHAVLVTPDLSMPRSPLCAVITVDQIPAWIAALPRQRSLSEGRCQRLLARIHEAVAVEDARRGRGARTRTWNQRDISPPL